LVDPSASPDGFREDEIGRLGDDVVDSIAVVAASRPPEATLELKGVTAEHEDVAEREEVREVADHHLDSCECSGAACGLDETSYVDLDPSPDRSGEAPLARELPHLHRSEALQLVGDGALARARGARECDRPSHGRTATLRVG
jgi:hypothetical protein